MSKKMRVIVDFPDDLYKQIKKLAGGSPDNVASFVYKEMRDNMRARAVENYQNNGKRRPCPENCRAVTKRVSDALCQSCRNLLGP